MEKSVPELTVESWFSMHDRYLKRRECPEYAPSRSDVVDMAAFLIRHPEIHRFFAGQKTGAEAAPLSDVAEMLVAFGYFDPQGQVLKYPEPAFRRVPVQGIEKEHPSILYTSR